MASSPEKKEIDELEETKISLDLSEIPDDGGFDSVGFDYNPEDLEKTPVSGTPITGFSSDSDDSQPTALPQTTTASQLAAVMAEFGFNVPEREPDWKKLQTGLIGIDLGSSDAVVASFNNDGKAVVMDNSIAERTTPTRLLLEANEDWLIGREAQSLAPSVPEQDIGDLKSLFLMEGWSTVINGTTYTSQQLLTIFIKRLLEELDPEDESFAPSHVALAAPVWFKEEQRLAMAEAIKDAGYTVVGVTDELLAACVPYSLRLPDLRSRKCVVVDVGHRGTSLAFTECVGGDIKILSQAGLPNLGAVNWDELLIAEGVRKFIELHDFDPRVDPACMTDLNRRVEQAKKALSSRKQCIMAIQSQGKTCKVRFTREAFERASQGMLRTINIFLNKAREKSGFESWAEFDALVVTGGGARIPMVRQVIEETVDRAAEAFNAEENVAIGALYWGMSARHQYNKKQEEKRNQ